MSKETKAQLMKRLWDEQEKCIAICRDVIVAQTKLEKAEQQRDEWEHLAESVIDGVRQTLNSDTKLYDTHHNTYYALWYWVEWGMKVNNKLKKESN